LDEAETKPVAEREVALPQPVCCFCRVKEKEVSAEKAAMV